MWSKKSVAIRDNVKIFGGVFRKSAKVSISKQMKDQIYFWLFYFFVSWKMKWYVLSSNIIIASGCQFT